MLYCTALDPDRNRTGRIGPGSKITIRKIWTNIFNFYNLLTRGPELLQNFLYSCGSGFELDPDLLYSEESGQDPRLHLKNILTTSVAACFIHSCESGSGRIRIFSDPDLNKSCTRSQFFRGVGRRFSQTTLIRLGFKYQIPQKFVAIKLKGID